MEQTKMIVEFNNTQIVCEGTELQMIEEMSFEYTDSVQDTDSYDNGQYLIKLPIKSVNGLNCNCFIKFGYYTSQRCRCDDTIIEEKKYTFASLKVFSTHLNMGENYSSYQMYYDKKILLDQYVPIFHTDIMKCIIKAKYLLSNLKYCYFENQLTLKPSHILLLSSIFENPNIELNCEECSICRITTTNRTPCNHSLCFICWEQIKENEDEIIPCPLCREDISNVE
jgi:hypothetical protein